MKNKKIKQSLNRGSVHMESMVPRVGGQRKYASTIVEDHKTSINKINADNLEIRYHWRNLFARVYCTEVLDSLIISSAPHIREAWKGLE